MLFVFLNKPRNPVKILYWEHNGFCLWLKRPKSERFKKSPDVKGEAIVLTVQNSTVSVQPAHLRFPPANRHAVLFQKGAHMKPPAELSARRAFRAEHVYVRCNSGMTRVAYCEQHKINPKSFGYLLRSRELESETPTMAPIAVNGLPRQVS